MQMPDPPASRRSFGKNVLLLGSMILFLVFSDWFNPGDKEVRLADGTRFEAALQYETAREYDLRLKEPALDRETGEVVRIAKSRIASIEDRDTWVVRIHHARWYLAAAAGILVLILSLAWLERREFIEWMGSTWSFAKQLVPLLFGGVFVVGFLGALLPEKQVAALVGDNSLSSNLVASIVGCAFYFATLTEVPILEALMKNGMASGPALALLLAGPALSIPSILVVRSVIGNRKTLLFIVLVVVMATGVGMVFGALTG